MQVKDRGFEVIAVQVIQVDSGYVSRVESKKVASGLDVK